MKLSFNVMLGFSLALLCMSQAVSNTSQTDQKEPSPRNVQYDFLSQRWLTQDELKQFENVHGIVLAVRLRLSNQSKRHVLYLATSGTVVPTGYHLFRSLGASSWQCTSPGRGREGPPGSEFTGVAYSWLELPPGAAVEVEAHDWSRSSEEHAFSTFVKFDSDSKPMEIVSTAFRPHVK
jgi:hypothetical protein